MAEDRIIQKVWVNKANGQKLITIPADSNISEGDFVEVNKVKYRVIRVGAFGLGSLGQPITGTESTNK